ncbi:MAG TPA: hypothetical protein VF070_28625 [Streptosporangiaceae bacterium]
MSAVTLLAVATGVTVPAATFTGLWFWRLRPGRRADLRPSTDAVLAHMAADAYARQRELQAQVEALVRAFDDRDRRLTAQATGMIETATKAARVDLGMATKRLGGQDSIGEGEHTSR